MSANIIFLLSIAQLYTDKEITGIIEDETAVILADWSKLRLFYNFKVGWHVSHYSPLIGRDIERIKWIEIK